jgi:hypothetical protein
MVDDQTFSFFSFLPPSSLDAMIHDLVGNGAADRDVADGSEERNF